MPALKNDWIDVGAPGFDPVDDRFDAEDQNDVADAVNGLILPPGTHASRPTADFPGRLYYCTDTDAVYKDNGSGWDRIRFGDSGTTQPEPPASSWVTTTMGAATISADKDARLLTVPTAAGLNIRAEYRTLSPASNYTITAHIESVALSNTDFFRSGLFLRDSGGKFISFGHSGDSSAKSSITAVQWNSATSALASYAVVPISDLGGRPNWFRIEDDGTNRYYKLSFNGVDWLEFANSTRTHHLTANAYGWGASNSTGKTAYVRLRSLSVT